MYIPVVDIIVPVWNRPVETRASLVNLTAHSPGARLILINNGSDRETESLLEEFADLLDERALLISSPMNHGFVKAANMGLARSEAEFALVVRSSTLVSAGWLEPLLNLMRARPGTGIVSPRFLRNDRTTKGHKRSSPCTETDHGDFSAMLIRREMYCRIGGFDEEMDSGIWCLKDYSRRALKAGYSTCTEPESRVAVVEEAVLGSVAPQGGAQGKEQGTSCPAVGAKQSLCVLIPHDVTPDCVREQLHLLVRGARQGHRFTVLVFPKTFREIARSEFGLFHSNIRLEKLPLLFASRRIEGVIRTLCAEEEPPTLVGRESEGITVEDLERLIDGADGKYYGDCSGEKSES